LLEGIVSKKDSMPAPELEEYFLGIGRGRGNFKRELGVFGYRGVGK